MSRAMRTSRGGQARPLHVPLLHVRPLHVLVLAALLSAPGAGRPGDAAWHHPLYLPGDGYWRARVAVTVHNETDRELAGTAVEVAAAALAGTPARAVRVCNARGTEMLFALVGAQGGRLTSGPIPDGARLTIPVECAARASAVYYVYFDNPAAGEVPEFLEQLTPGLVRAEVGPTERMTLAEEPGGSVDRYGECPRRAVVKAFHFSPEAGGERFAAVDLSTIAARARGRLDRKSLAVVSGGKRVAHGLLGDTLLFEAALPARTAATWHVYFRDDGAAAGEQDAPPPSSGHEDLAAVMTGPRNLVRNPSFEQGDSLPEHWTGPPPAPGPGGITFGLGEPGAPGLGRRAARLHVPHDAPKSWRGWRQDVPIEPGRTYLLAGWVKTEDVRGKAQLHAHLRTADGNLGEEAPYRSAGPAVGGTTDWTLMSATMRMPPDAATLQLHLTMDTTGTLWHDGLLVAELLPVELTAFEGRTVSPAESFCVWQVPAIEKVFPDDPAQGRAPSSAAANTSAPIEIALARNEREPLQLAVRSARAIRGVRVEAEPLRGPGGATLDVDVNVVGCVPVDHPTSYYRSDSPAWHRKFPKRRGSCDGWAGIWPDPLLPTDTLDLVPDETRAVWITVAAGKDAPSGRYAGRVRLEAEGKTLRELEVVATVWDFALPEHSRLAAIYDVRLGPGRERWGGSFEENYRVLVRFLAERRLCPDRVWPEPKLDYVDGRVKADFTEFDRAAAWYFDELKLPAAYTPQVFYLFGWAHPPGRKFGEAPYDGEPPWDDVDRGQLRPEFKRAYQACLRAFWDHVLKRGWADRFVLYISDEPHFRHEHIRRQMEALCRMIHEVDPAIPVYSSTWHHVPEWDGSLDVWGISHYGRVPVEQMGRLRAAGKRLWFTTDGQMCLDTPYCAVERLLPHYCFKYGVDAYEFWGAAWLTYDPYRFGWHAYIRQADRPGNYYWVRYPNGDGYLIYPGGPLRSLSEKGSDPLNRGGLTPFRIGSKHDGPVSTVRLEQAREGVEDYEYLCLLRARIEAARAAGRDTSRAERALEQAAALVTVPNAGGRYSTRILPDPTDVYEARRVVAAAIEGLRLK